MRHSITVELQGLRICFVVGSLGQGGAERQLYYMLRALKEAGTEVQLLCLSQGEFWEAPIRVLGVPVTWVGAPTTKLGRLWEIVQWIWRERPDVVQSQLFYTNIYAALAARLSGTPEIGAIRNNLYSEMTRSGRVLGYLSLHLPRQLAANSHLAMRNAQAEGISSSRLHFLANVVDTEHFRPATLRSEGPFRILTVGRLVQQKRHDRFIEVIAALQQRTSHDVEGIIVGGERSGFMRRPELEKQALALGVCPGTLTFRGEVADMRAAYQEADCFLLTSDWEGTPNVVLEAMASGLPVVATRVGGIPDVIEDGVTGFLVDPSDTASQVRHLQMLADDAALRKQIGQRARAFVLSNHALNQLPRYLNTLYSTVIL